MKPTSRFIALAAIFLIPLFPLIIANSFFFPFITGKAFYFRILVEIAFASWVILAFLDAKYRPKLNALTIGVTVFTIVTLVADFLGVNPIRSLSSNFERMEGWVTIVHLWAFFMVTTSMFGTLEDGKRMWHRWFNVSLATASIVGIYGIVQLLGYAEITQGGARVDSTLGNAEYMAVYMLLSAGMAAYLFFVARKRKIAGAEVLQWVYPVLAVVFSFLLYETATRGTILGLIGAIMLALFVYAVFGRKEPQRNRVIAGSIIGFIVLVGVVFWFNRQSAFVQNSETLRRMALISWQDTQTQARAYIWPMALTGFTQRPVLGWGQENFNYIFNANYNPKMWSQEQWFDRAHDVYLDWLTASGLVGLLSYLALYVFLFWAVWKSSMTIAEKSVITGLIAGYMVHNVFVFDNLASYVLFFALLGFAASLREDKPIRWLGTSPVRMDAVEYIVAPIAIIALLACLYVVDVRPIEANTRLITALESCNGPTPDISLFESALSVGSYMANQEIREQIITCASDVISSQQIPDPTKQAFYELAGQQIQAQIDATPKDARIYTLAGGFLAQLQQFSQAESLLEVAHALSPGKQTIIFPLASSYLETGDTDKALALLKQAYESATDDQMSQSSYATALVISGQDKLAHQIFGTDPKVFDTQQMAQAYSAAKEYPQAIAIYQSLIGTSTDAVDLQAALAQTQYMAGMISQALATLHLVEKNHPEYKTQIDAFIQQIENPAPATGNTQG